MKLSMREPAHGLSSKKSLPHLRIRISADSFIANVRSEIGVTKKTSDRMLTEKYT